jgi:hypothetical protein
LNSKSKPERKVCSEVTPDSEENIWASHTGAEATADGKYQCRYCGRIFETLEAHEQHHRKVHGKSQGYLTTANQS